MKLKFFKPPEQKYNKERLYRLALREALSQLTLHGPYESYDKAYKTVMKKAKELYHSKKNKT